MEQLTYYNDNDPFICAWLRELIANGLITPGVVDEQSIDAIRPDDLAGYRRVHFFAGIAGWDYALKLAGWPAGREVWTGSCPCQPFSAAGKQQALHDERDKWPAFFSLIAECRPEWVFGEQVEAAIRWGWLDRICDDLGRESYTVRAAVLPACGVGAPHIRQRLFWVAHRDGNGTQWAGRAQFEFISDGAVQRLGKSHGSRWGAGQSAAAALGYGSAIESAGNDGGLGNALGAGLEGRRINTGKYADQRTPWAASQPVYCRNGKWRRIPLEPALQPLAPWLPNRVGLLRGAGNSIVPQVAAAFIKAVMEEWNS